MAITEHCHDTQFIPERFFPNASTDMKQFFWYSLTIEKMSVHDALMQYLKDAINTPVEREIAEMIAETLERDWLSFLAAEHINAVV